MTLLAGVNPLVGSAVPGDASAASVESRPPGTVTVFPTDAGIEWVVAALALGALGVLILFKLAGFQGAIAVRVGG